MRNISYSQSRNRVNKRPVKIITLDEDLLIKKYNDQQGKCFWSGLDLDQKYNYIKHHPFAISVERLDNSKDYDYENTVLTRRIFNLGRMAFPEAGFKEVISSLQKEFTSIKNN